MLLPFGDSSCKFSEQTTWVFRTKVKSNDSTKKKNFPKKATIPSKVLLSSYKVAWQITKIKKPHTTAESCILPAAMDIMYIIIGDAATKQL